MKRLFYRSYEEDKEINLVIKFLKNFFGVKYFYKLCKKNNLENNKLKFKF